MCGLITECAKFFILLVTTFASSCLRSPSTKERECVRGERGTFFVARGGQCKGNDEDPCVCNMDDVSELRQLRETMARDLATTTAPSGMTSCTSAFRGISPPRRHVGLLIAASALVGGLVVHAVVSSSSGRGRGHKGDFGDDEDDDPLFQRLL